MTGTLQTKRGKYYCVLDFKDEKWSRKLKWISTGLEVKGNKHKTTEFLNRLLAEYTQKLETTNSENYRNILFTDCITQWMKKRKNKVK